MRSAWVMRLRPGQEAEYKRKHNEIWPEMVALAKPLGQANAAICRGYVIEEYLKNGGDEVAVVRPPTRLSHPVHGPARHTSAWRFQ